MRFQFTVLVDIDGVVADCSHRLGFIEREKPDWDAFFEACSGDLPHIPMIRFLCELEQFRLIYVTGRPERTRAATEKWFGLQGVPWDILLMRKDGDHRPDHIVKLELAKEYLPGVLAVVEDRDQVVAMWREHGLLCLQPKKGDY
jgi:hypothetical protein